MFYALWSRICLTTKTAARIKRVAVFVNKKIYGKMHLINYTVIVKLIAYT